MANEFFFKFLINDQENNRMYLKNKQKNSITLIFLPFSFPYLFVVVFLHILNARD